MPGNSPKQIEHIGIAVKNLEGIRQVLHNNIRVKAIGL